MHITSEDGKPWPSPTHNPSHETLYLPNASNMEKVIINIVLPAHVVALNSLWALCTSRSNKVVFVIVG